MLLLHRDQAHESLVPILYTFVAAISNGVFAAFKVQVQTPLEPQLPDRFSPTAKCPSASNDSVYCLPWYNTSATCVNFRLKSPVAKPLLPSSTFMTQ
jgi:hypothetical protein